MPDESLRFLSLTQLSEASGRSRQTIRKRLAKARLRPSRQDRRTVWYDAPLALGVILGSGQGLNPQAEKARLDKARADMQEFQLSTRRGEVAPVAEIARVWSGIAATSRKAILSIPARATAQISGFNKSMARKLAELLDATLTELDAGDAEPSR